MGFFGHLFLVGREVHQLGDRPPASSTLILISQPSPYGIIGQELNVLRDPVLTSDHLAADRRIQVADGLDALDLAEALARRPAGFRPRAARS